MTPGRGRRATARRAHALAAFADRFVGQPDHGEGGRSGRHPHLNVDLDDVDALERDGVDARNHAARKTVAAADDVTGKTPRCRKAAAERP